MLVVNPLPDQLLVIRYAAISGAALGMLYDIFRILRWNSGSRCMELVLDFLFSVVSAAVLFVLAPSVTQLQLRGFLFLSFAAGWVLWNLLPGRLFRRILRKTGGILHHIGHICRKHVRLHGTDEKKSVDFRKKHEKTKKKPSIFGNAGIK